MKIFFFNRKKYDYMQATLTEGLLSLGHEVVGYFMANYCCSNLELKNWEDLAEYDLIIFGESQIKYLKRLRGERSSFSGKIICIDGADDPKIRVKGYLLANVYFKRELNQIISRSNFLHSSILPISFAIEKRYCLGKELASKRDLDFVCMMNLNTNPYRKEVQEFLDQYFLNEQLNTYVGMTGERAYGSESYPLETPIYYSKLAGSRIALSMHGAGQDCARYWEILASGALLISQRMTNHVVNEPIDGEHCYYFDSISELEKVLNFVFANPELVERVAKNGSEFSLEYHSSKARAAYFLGGLMSYKVSIYSKLIGLIKILYYNFMVSWQLKRIVAI